MATHGGARQNAGRKPKNYWAGRLEMAISAIERGFSQAGQEKLGIADPVEAGAATIATIVSDAIKAGQGVIPLKLYVDLMAKTSANASEDAGSGSPIIDAMRQLPGMPGHQSGAPAAQISDSGASYRDESVTYEQKAGDLKSDAPTFEPQTRLFAGWPAAAGGALPSPPTPPLPLPPGEYPVESENLEKIDAPL